MRDDGNLHLDGVNGVRVEGIRQLTFCRAMCQTLMPGLPLLTRIPHEYWSVHLSHTERIILEDKWRFFGEVSEMVLLVEHENDFAKQRKVKWFQAKVLRAQSSVNTPELFQYEHMRWDRLEKWLKELQNDPENQAQESEWLYVLIRSSWKFLNRAMMRYIV